MSLGLPSCRKTSENKLFPTFLSAPFEQADKNQTEDTDADYHYQLIAKPTFGKLFFHVR